MTTKKAKNNWNIKIWRGARHAPMSPKGSFFCGFNNGIDSIEWTYVLFGCSKRCRTGGCFLLVPRPQSLHFKSVTSCIWIIWMISYDLTWLNIISWFEHIWNSFEPLDGAGIALFVSVRAPRIAFVFLPGWISDAEKEVVPNVQETCSRYVDYQSLFCACPRPERRRKHAPGAVCVFACFYWSVTGPRAVHAASTVAAAGGTTPRIMIIRIY